MKTRSPQRTRRIRYALVIGAVIGLAIGLLGWRTWNSWFYMIFIPFGALISAGTVSVTSSDYDYD